VQEIDDRDALAVVAALKRRRGGEQLLAYRAGRGWADCSAEEVNTYIAEHADGPFTAKDFRTWHATVLAAAALAARARQTGAKATRARRDREVAAAIKTVAAYLGNTPAVCRASYDDPRVIDRYHAGATIAPALGRLMTGPNGHGPELSARACAGASRQRSLTCSTMADGEPVRVQVRQGGSVRWHAVCSGVSRPTPCLTPAARLPRRRGGA
jgi:hypothetical protein